MSSLSDEIIISPATESDFPTIFDIEVAAFSDFSTLQLMFPPDSDPAPLAISRYMSCFLHDRTARFTVARVPSGEIVGFGKWNFFLDPEDVAGPQHPWPMQFSPKANLALLKYYFGAVDDKRNGWMRKGKAEGEPGQRHLFMATLCVSPNWQRKGVGKKLLEWGLEIADRERVECWIDASPKGKGLYEKMGWREVDGVDVELGKWGGEEGKVSRTVCMIREPQGEKKA